MRPALVSLRRVSVRRGPTRVLRDLDFAIHQGERIVLQGENGIGKSTLLRTVLGLIRPESGQIERTDERGTGSFAYLPQELLSGDLPISVTEVVDIGLIGHPLSRSERNRKITHLLEALGCLQLADRCFSTLSGGEKQRVSLARCLAQAPAMLALDEPTAGLDPQMQGRFYPLIQELADFHGAAVLVVTHDTRAVPDQGWHQLRLEQSESASVLTEISDA